MEDPKFSIGDIKLTAPNTGGSVTGVSITYGNIPEFKKFVEVFKDYVNSIYKKSESKEDQALVLKN